MWSLGWQETVFIFLLALLIFGPKKLPELGKTIAKGLAEFRRASTDLKSTFDKEMANIERETQDVKQDLQKYSNEISNYDSSYENSYYDSGYDGYNSEASQESSTASASATQGAESSTLPVGTEEDPAANSAVVSSNGAADLAGNQSGTQVAEAEPDHQGAAADEGKPVARA
jgi:TatA/E family protein of Tat protein translocase